MTKYDVIIIGAGAAGLSAAAQCAVRGRRTLVIDMGATPGRKIAISGGGRCNFTNIAAGRDRYFGENPDFVKAALSRISPTDILEWATTHKINSVEKAPGQYFCATGAHDVVRALLRDADAATILTNTTVTDVKLTDGKFIVYTNDNSHTSESLIIATGGISFPTLGVSDIGYKIAKKFGHRIVPVRPGLCAIKISDWPTELAGTSVMAQISGKNYIIRDAMLFTHFGIGGPAAYRASVRDISGDMHINLMPDIDVYDTLRAAKRSEGRKTMATYLSAYLPARVAKWCVGDDRRNLADWSDKQIRELADKISNLSIAAPRIKPHGMVGAEVTRGGVATDEISSKTMESRRQPGLFFAGEVIDIAGDLGGFNLHWAFASGRVAGQNA